MPIKLDVQVVSATNADLREKVAKGEFREDLFYRLKVMEIRLPSLVERREDIPLLVKHYVDVFRKKFRKDISAVSPGVERLFMSYGWPGNVRELVHTLEHAFVICQGRTIGLEDLPPEIREQTPAATAKEASQEDPEKDVIIGALRKAGWNKAKAAKLLGMSRPTIYRRMLELGISLADEPE
jgi:two-component system, NtrC family, response regulator HydG